MEERTYKDVLLLRLEELDEALEGYDAGSEEYSKIMVEMHKVINDLNEIAKVEAEQDKINYQRDRDFIERIFRGVEITGKIAVPLVLAFAAFYFEKEDSFTSTIGRRLFGNAVPKM